MLDLLGRLVRQRCTDARGVHILLGVVLETLTASTHSSGAFVLRNGLDFVLGVGLFDTDLRVAHALKEVDLPGLLAASKNDTDASRLSLSPEHTLLIKSAADTLVCILEGTRPLEFEVLSEFALAAHAAIIQADEHRALEALVDERSRQLRDANAGLAEKNAALEEAMTELSSAQQMLVHREKMASIGVLAAGVAHEINNPVGFVQSNLNSLRRYAARLEEFTRAVIDDGAGGGLESDGGERSEQLTRLRKKLKIDFILEDLDGLIEQSLQGTQRIRKIVSDLRSFSREDQDEPGPVELNAVLQSVLEMAHNELKYKAEVIREFQPVPVLQGLPGRLSQVFLNLLINASQAIERDGRITVSTRHEGDQVRVDIRDNGVGMDEQTMRHVFEPFFTTKAVGQGTGLGLHLAYGIVENHGGSIEVQSEVGVGTCFSVSLPVAGSVGKGGVTE